MIVVCEVVVENGFKDWPQFDFADDPSVWDGAERLVAEELRFLREFISKGRQRPRCVSPFLFVCNGVLCRSPVGQAAELTLAQLAPRVSRDGATPILSPSPPRSPSEPTPSGGGGCGSRRGNW